MSSNSEWKQDGFDAISARLDALYPGQKEFHYGVLIPYSLGGRDPLDGISVYKSENGIPHWHYITYGFTELYEKASDDPKTSGYGFELTFRLKRGDEEQPPVWPMNLLQNLARYVFSSGNVFGPGHHINCNGPIALEEDTLLTALGFRIDPELGEQDTPNGHMAFLQAVGITEDEMDAMMCWNGQKFLAALAEHLPLCVTDLSRGSQMDDPAFRTVWRAGMERDGSFTAFLCMNELAVRLDEGRVTLRLSAGHDRTLANMLRARVGKGRELFLQGSDAIVLLRPGERAEMGEENGMTVLTLPKDALKELCGVLRPHAGTYTLSTFPMTVELTPTTITDQDGNVIKVIE